MGFLVLLGIVATLIFFSVVLYLSYSFGVYELDRYDRQRERQDKMVQARLAIIRSVKAR